MPLILVGEALLMYIYYKLFIMERGSVLISGKWGSPILTV